MIIRQRGGNPFIFIIGIFLFMVFLLGIFYMASWLFEVLAWATPVLLIATAVINYKVILNYGKWLIDTLEKNVISGIFYIVFTIIGFPFVAGWLFIKALGGYFVKKKIDELRNNQKQTREDEYIEYEEVSSEIKQEQKIEERRRS